MPREIVKPLAVRERTGRPLYCGEFGCIGHCPDELRRRWLKDFVALLNREHIGWSNWDYRGLFGAFTPQGQPTVVAESLLN
jgi:endoglucanase